jgi:hypothetical protein
MVRTCLEVVVQCPEESDTYTIHNYTLKPKILQTAKERQATHRTKPRHPKTTKMHYSKD